MVDLGALGVDSILAALVVAGFVATILYFLIKPLAVSIYNRNPGFLFPTNSLRLLTLREEIRARGFHWYLKFIVQSRRSLLTYWSFIWVVPLGFLIIFALAHLQLPMVDMIQTGLIRPGWQAQLTISSLGFIVLIFLLERISRAEYREGVVQEFFASSRIMPVIYFTLATSGLVGYLYFYHSPENTDPLFVDATFFIFTGTVLGIGYIYYRVARLIFFDPMDELSVKQVERGIDLQLREGDIQNISDSLLEDSLPDSVEIGINRDARVFMAQELGLDGYISDIDLERLEEVCKEYSDFFADDGAALVLNIGLGDEMQPGVDVVSVDGSNVNVTDVPSGLADGLSDAIYCSDERPWKSGDRLMERNLDQIGASTRNAIENLNPSGLKKYLEFYTDLLQHSTDLNREVISDYGVTPTPISNLVDHIYREFYRIMEAAGRTGSSDLINTVRGEIFRLSLAYHRQGEPYLFEKSISLYASYYKILSSSQAASNSLIHGLLTSMDNILTMLTADLGRARNAEEVDQIASDLDSFFDALENILRLSVEEGDPKTFNNVWNLGADDFVMVRPEGDIYDLEYRIDQSTDSEEIERLERELEVKQKQQETVESLQSEFSETQFTAAAWAYREVRNGNLSEEAFRDMFSESIRNYSFERLAEIYFGLLSNPRLDLFRWERDDADVFKGVQTSRPAVHTWLKGFFAAMGLIFLDTEGYDVDDLDESDNPMASLDVERTSYPDLEEEIENISRGDLSLTGIAETELDSLDEKKELFLALHHQMQEILERREEDQIIDSDLDPEKVANFEDNYRSEFNEQFVLRDIFEDLGWLDIQSFAEDLDVEGAGFNVFYPKGGFIPDPPAEFIHSLEQRVRNHIEFLVNQWLEEGQEFLDEEIVDAYDSLPTRMAELCLEQEDKGRIPQAVIISGFRAKNVLTNSNRFDKELQPHEEAIGGFTYDGETVPVFNDSTGDFEALILAGADQPVEVTEYQREQEPVFVKIEKVTRQLLEELDPEGFQELSEEEIREKLQTVRFRALYYSEIQVSDKFGAIVSVQSRE